MQASETAVTFQHQQESDKRKSMLAELKTCSRTHNLQRGKQLHAKIRSSGFEICSYITSALINMYAKCGCMVEARQVFDNLKHPNVVSWNVLILGYAVNGEALFALDLLKRMKREGCMPDAVTFMAALKACMKLEMKTDHGWKDRGRAIHNLAMLNDCISDSHVQSTLIDMYAKSGCMMEAQQVFDSMRHPDVVCWTALILGYAENGQGLTALKLFSRMKEEGLEPDAIMFLAVLKACISFAAKGTNGRNVALRIHLLATQNGLDSDSYVRNTLIDMYCKCRCMTEAFQVFENTRKREVVSWNVLILGYADNGKGHAGLKLFERMEHEGPAPDSLTFVAALKACISFLLREGVGVRKECRDWGKRIHFLISRNGRTDICVQNTLIDMYSKCGCMKEAHELFDTLKRPDLVSWTTLISGYADNGEGLPALELLMRMKRDGPPADSVTLAAALKACALLGALSFGRSIHSEIICGNHMDAVVLNCLVDFYAKCGSLAEAQSVFNEHEQMRDAITWNALLTGFSSCGEQTHIFRLFEEMQNAGFQPNRVTFVSVLACCSHSGLVEKGREYLEMMSSKYGLVPGVEHYNCMADMFGRANQFDNALAMFRSMGWSPDCVTWRTTLGACRKWKNVEIGRLAFQSLTCLSNTEFSAYVVMGQIYHGRGMFREQAILMAMRKKLHHQNKKLQNMQFN